MTPQTPEARHRRNTLKLLLQAAVIWFFFACFAHLFVKALNEITLFGFPFGFLVAAQISPLALIGLCYWHEVRQARIDEDYKLRQE